VALGSRAWFCDAARPIHLKWSAKLSASGE
jgi:hypothetical protein